MQEYFQSSSKSFIYFDKKLRSKGSTIHHPSDLIFMFLESVEHSDQSPLVDTDYPLVVRWPHYSLFIWLKVTWWQNCSFPPQYTIYIIGVKQLIETIAYIGIVYLCYANAIHQVSLFYYAWNWSKSLWSVVGGWCVSLF